jgi:hypothetical protein
VVDWDEGEEARWLAEEEEQSEARRRVIPSYGRIRNVKEEVVLVGTGVEGSRESDSVDDEDVVRCVDGRRIRVVSSIDASPWSVAVLDREPWST